VYYHDPGNVFRVALMTATVVPEPGTVAMVGLAAVALLRRSPRRRHSAKEY
jgi:hypothetical protein